MSLANDALLSPIDKCLIGGHALGRKEESQLSSFFVTVSLMTFCFSRGLRITNLFEMNNITGFLAGDSDRGPWHLK
jgi:hypothetical protein